jgi:catechol 2,3-dioxygenase-like lactoylglutathione lyase family enzyme
MILRVWDVTFTVSDLARAVDFYEGVLDLPKKYQFSNYAGFDCGGVEIGLIPGNVAENQAGAPCVDLLVRDVDEVYRLLRGRHVRFLKEPHDTAWGGRIALFADPDGNLLQLAQIDWPKYFAVCAPSE